MTKFGMLVILVACWVASDPEPNYAALRSGYDTSVEKVCSYA